jgi:hypothetical protein
MLRAASPAQGPVTELALMGSHVDGDDMRLVFPRRHLLTALKRGFRQFVCLVPDKIIRSEDEGRVYLWMPCEPKGALAPSDNAVRIEAPEPGTVRVTRSPTTSRSHEPMPRVSRATSPYPEVQPEAVAANGQAVTNPTSNPTSNTSSSTDTSGVSNGVANTGPAATPLEQAIELRNSLRQTLDQVNGLVSSLKRQKRQQKLMQTTLATLRELRTAEAA